MRERLRRFAYVLLVVVGATTILRTWITGGEEVPGALSPDRPLRPVDSARVERLIQQQRLSDREAMFYRPLGTSPVPSRPSEGP